MALKLECTDGISQGEMLLVFGISGMIAVFFISAARGVVGNLQPQHWGGLIVIGLCQLIAYVTWMTVLPSLPLANLYVISFLAPMIIACLAAAFLKERMDWRRAAAIIVGFAGVMISINPENLLKNEGTWEPYIVIFINLVVSSVQMFLLRLVADKERNESTSFFPRLVMIVAGMIWCAKTGFTALSPGVFAALCAQGALGGICWALMAQAYKDAPAIAVAPFEYFQIIAGAFFGYVIWGDKPNAYLFVGSIIIVISGLYLVRHERRISRAMIRAER